MRKVMISGDFTINEVNKETVNDVPNRKVQERIEALRKAGVDVSNLFAMGEQMLVRVENGIPSQVCDDDPIFQKLCTSGYVNHYKLFRRWVMAQMFRMLRRSEDTGKSLNAIIQSYGYEYSWRMLEREFLAQAKMSKHCDFENYDARRAWFDGRVANAMALDYIKQLKSYVNHQPEHKCRGRFYKKIGSKNVFCSDIEAVVFAPLYHLADDMRHVYGDKLYQCVRDFNRTRKHMEWTAPVSRAFLDAYKGSGAYFTCKNLILFHGARFAGMPSEKESLTHLDKCRKDYSEHATCDDAISEGWRMVGVMKKLIADSNISIEGKIAEWDK